MADAIELYMNVGTPTGALVRGLSDSGAFTMGPFYQGQLLKLRVYPVIPTGVLVPMPGAAQFSKVDLTNLDLQVVIGPRAGASSVKAAQYTWAKQTANDSEGKSGYFYANLDLNTTDLNTAIGTSDTYDTYIEFQLSRGGLPFAPAYQSAIQIISAVLDPSGAAAVPTPAASYLTAAQCFNLFVMWNNALAAGGANAGRNVIFVSPDSAHTRELGVGNAAEPIDNAT